MKTETNPWMTDPHQAAEAVRDATLQALDAAAALQAEAHKAWARQAETFRADSERALGGIATAIDASFEAGEKIVGWSREQVDRFGRPESSEG